MPQHKKVLSTMIDQQIETEVADFGHICTNFKPDILCRAVQFGTLNEPHSFSQFRRKELNLTMVGKPWTSRL